MFDLIVVYNTKNVGLIIGCPSGQAEEIEAEARLTN